MFDWQPIETAPRDGTAILLGHAESGFCLVGEWWVIDWWTSGPFEDGRGNELPMIRLDFEPDCWMPLPSFKRDEDV
jgi:hypothetical protein